MKKYIVGELLKQGDECIIIDGVVHKVESERKIKRPCMKCHKNMTTTETSIYYEGKLVRKKIGKRICNACHLANKRL